MSLENEIKALTAAVTALTEIMGKATHITVSDAKETTEVKEVKVDTKEVKAEAEEVKVDTKEVKAEAKEVKVDAKEVKAEAEEVKETKAAKKTVKKAKSPEDNDGDDTITAESLQELCLTIVKSDRAKAAKIRELIAGCGEGAKIINDVSPDQYATLKEALENIHNE